MSDGTSSNIIVAKIFASFMAAIHSVVFSVLLIASPLASAQQKPSLKQLEQQARDRLEADRRRRQDLEAQALDRQRREASDAISRQQRDAAAAAAAAEADRQRFLDQEAKDAARIERTPIVKGDSLVCPNGGYRREAARLVDTNAGVRHIKHGGLLGRSRAPSFGGWRYLPDYWTKPPVRAFVMKTTEFDASRYELDPRLYAEETELKALADMMSDKVFLLGKNRGEFEQRLSLVGKSGSDHDLYMSEEIITLTTNDKVYDSWNGDTDRVQSYLDRAVYLCIDDTLQERVLVDLYRTSVNEFGERKKFSLYSVLVITDISFTEVTAASDQSAFSTITITVDAIGNAISDLRMVDTEGSGKVRKIMLTKGRYRLRPVTIESSGRDSAVVFCRCNFKQGAPPYFWIYDYATSEKGRSRVGVQVPENRQFSAAEAFSKAPIDSFELKSDGWIKLFIYDDVIQDNAGAVSVAIERLSPN